MELEMSIEDLLNKRRVYSIDGLFHTRIKIE